ncbi:TolC family outer membrane protein [Pseudoduganella umbonata]|uniref:Outer membrane protein n=1 Tax=Pseudoduganella umbonata TaxID=864828 RepID=A0A4P8HS89_9BURK|nr:TolC family outer membrane protein [Pseudoduganella umbonata]MBB3220402.1 outer membrane protein [Pseudoduganella umbonata]QCP12066.1 TolC family outer membrane protein [Pseudoduganella umbonata]
MQRPLIAVLIASALTLTGQAQAADLIQVYQQALANDATFAGARNTLTAGQERITQGRSQLLPAVALQGTHARIYDRVTPPGGIKVENDSHQNIYTLSLSQPLFDYAAWQAYEQSKLSQAFAEVQFAQVQQDLILRVAQAYFDVLTAQDNLASIQAQKSATTEQLASAKRNFEVGTQTITDTHEAQAAYDLVVAQEFAAINSLEVARTALQQIIGTAPAAVSTLRAGVTIAPPQPANIEPWISAAEADNFNVAAQRLNVEIAKREIARSRAGHLPTVDLTANSNRTSQPSLGINRGNSIGVTWTVPIFNGFAVTSKVRETIALEERARNDLEVNRRAAAQSARQAFLGVNSGLAQVKALEAAEVSSQSALESNKLGYQVGVRINIDVLNAQRQLYSTQRDLSKARYDTIMNGLRLKAAAGTLKPDDLVPVNALLTN